jgi:hypothetical protein
MTMTRPTARSATVIGFRSLGNKWVIICPSNGLAAGERTPVRPSGNLMTLSTKARGDGMKPIAVTGTTTSVAAAR